MKPTKPPSTFHHLLAVLLLPVTATVVIPAILLWWFPSNDGGYFHPLRIIFSALYLALGGLLFVESVRLFVRIGRGTLAPWHPTKNLVVKGLYRYLRNPMILGVALLLLGESCIFSSKVLLGWAILFILINHLYFLFFEEPDLLRRFGAEYEEYRAQVPRWFPRLNGWYPEQE